MYAFVDYRRPKLMRHLLANTLLGAQPLIKRRQRQHLKDVDLPGILTQARQNFERAKTLPTAHLPPNLARWGIFQKELADHIARFEDVFQALKFAHEWGNFDHRRIMRRFRGLRRAHRIQTFQTLLQLHFPKFGADIPNFADSMFTPKETALFQIHNGDLRQVSEILFYQISFVLRLLEAKPDITSICEIGGGYGNTAFQWLTNPIQQAETYTILDLPESLFFAEVFLRVSLPSVPVDYVLDGPT